MKRFLLTIFLLATPAHAEWTQQNSGTTADLVDVCFVDALHGWAIGNDEIGYPVIIKTDDGGITWQPQELPEEWHKLYRIYFIDAQIGFIASQCRRDGEGFYSHIFSTTDGGQTWEISCSVPQYYRCMDIFFIDENIGWVVGQVNGDTKDLWGGCVLSTTDGGTTWNTQLHLPGADSTSHYSFDAIVFADEDHGWMLGNEYHLFSPPPTRLYETIDGGDTWVISKEFSIDEHWTSGLQIIHPDTLWTSKGSTRNSFTGGDDWSEVLISPPSYDFAPISGTQGWASHADYDVVEVLYTTDGGITWEQQFSHDSLNISALDAVNAQFACGVGTSGVIITYKEQTSVVDFPSPPVIITLDPNYPNPFNASTTISFTLAADSPVTVNLYSATGQLVRKLCEQSMPAGRHSVVIDGKDLSSGMYVARVQAQEATKYTRMLLLK